MKRVLKNAKNAKKYIANLGAEEKNAILLKMAKALLKNKNVIIKANKIDLKLGEKNGLSPALLDRLLLDEKRVASMAKALEDVAKLDNPIGKIIKEFDIEDNLHVKQVSVPLGVIGIIYESRPNVTSDTAGLCFKSGNVSVLKGGKEAKHSNQAIALILQNVLKENNLPKEAITLIEGSREDVAKLLKEDKYIDLIIPRGGEGLVKFVSQNSTIPVIKHDKGLCHVYIDKYANIRKAIKIAINAKCQRTGVCNAMETLLIHEDVAKKITPLLKQEFDTHKTLLKGCKKTREYIDVQVATKEDFATEYLANTLSIKIVKSLKKAIEHISKYGSMHSEAIITENPQRANKFLEEVDASCVYLNASTRYTDGGLFGFGGEIGISTNRLHVRGPVGADALTTYKYKIYGNGQVRK